MLSVLLVAALVLAINFAAVPGEGAVAIGLGAIALAATGRVRHPPAPRPLAALRPRDRRAPRLLGRRVRRRDRVRDADGGDVRRPAVPPERARLLDARGRRRDPAGGRGDGALRPALGEARRGARRARHPAVGLRLLPARLRDDAPALGGGRLLLEGRARLRARRRRRRLRGHAGLALAHRLGPGQPRGHGLGHGRPPARPRRRDHAVDPRRAAHRGLRGRGGGGRRGLAGQRADHRRHRGPAAEVVRQRGAGRRASTRSTPTRSPPAPSRRSSTAPTGPTRPGSSRSCSARRSSSSCSRARDEEEELLARYAAEDAAA